MSPFLPRPDPGLTAQPVRDAVPRRMLVTASVVAFAIRDWSLWVLLRSGPWGAPMRLVLGTESVADAVGRSLEALLLWPEDATLLQLRSGWQEQSVPVWGSVEQGMSVSLLHSVLLRANRDQLRPHLHQQPIPSLHVEWVAVADIESGQYMIDEQALPGVLSALHTLRAYVQREPASLLEYLADMGKMSKVQIDGERWSQPGEPRNARETLPLSVIKEPSTGDGILTLAEASLLYRAFFASDDSLDLSKIRRRFLATNRLDALSEDRPVRGRESEKRRVSRAYRYLDPQP